MRSVALTIDLSVQSMLQPAACMWRCWLINQILAIAAVQPVLTSLRGETQRLMRGKAPALLVKYEAVMNLHLYPIGTCMIAK